MALATIGMEIEGMAELRQRLDQLKTKDATRILNKALQAGAEVFKEEEEARAPERPELPSGTALPPGALRGDVHIRKVPGPGSVYVVGPGKYTGKAAHLVEFGHRLVRGGKNRVKKYGIQVGPGKVVGWVSAHPYIRPTFETAQATAQDAIAQSVEDDLAKLDYKNSLKTKGRR